MKPNEKSSRKSRMPCSSDGSVANVMRCEYFEAVFSNFAPNSGAAESGANEQDSVNNNNSYNPYNFNGYRNNFANIGGVGGANDVAPGADALSGFELVTTASPCGCEVTMIPASIPVYGVLPPVYYGETGSGVPPDLGAGSPPPGNGIEPDPPSLGGVWPGGSSQQASSVVPELPTSTLFLIGAGGLALAMRRARNPLRGLFRA
jgi:hypothetical protein